MQRHRSNRFPDLTGWSVMVMFCAVFLVNGCGRDQPAGAGTAEIKPGISSAPDDPEFSFGVVPQYSPQQLASVWLPILEELGRQTGYRFRMEGSPRIPEFEENFMSGRFDFAYMNPYHSVIAARTQGFVPLIRDHGRELYGILVVKKNSPVEDISDLDGQVISFPSPNALGASLLMRAELSGVFGIEYEPWYVQTHSSVYLQVALGKAAAGGGVYSTLMNQPPDVRDQLRVFYETRRLSPHPIVYHPRIPWEVADAVRKALMEMGATDEGAELLRKVPILQPGPAVTEDYLNLLELGLEEYAVSRRQEG